MTDLQAILIVRSLRHRIGQQPSCKCEECEAIKRVCHLASQHPTVIATPSSPERPND